jgi:hypothetical protein
LPQGNIFDGSRRAVLDHAIQCTGIPMPGLVPPVTGVIDAVPDLDHARRRNRTEDQEPVAGPTVAGVQRTQPGHCDICGQQVGRHGLFRHRQEAHPAYPPNPPPVERVLMQLAQTDPTNFQSNIGKWLQMLGLGGGGSTTPWQNSITAPRRPRGQSKEINPHGHV